MRIYVAGCGGMLGEAIHSVLGMEHELCCTDIDVNDTWLHYCDFRDLEEYRQSVVTFRPSLLIHLGAHTDLEFCEQNPDEAYRTNTLSVEHAALIASTLQIPLVYVSTAGIYDGAKDTYDDWDPPNPLGVYARSKYMGEIVVQNRIPHHFICRAGWMMGGGIKKDKKFIGKLMRKLASGTKSLHVVDDKFGSPTYTVDFARNLSLLLKTELYGLYNMVCAGEASRLEVARHLLHVLSLENDVEIVPVQSEFFAEEYFAPRPRSERLVNRKLRLRGLDAVRDWRSALTDYVCKDYAEYAKSFAPHFDPDIARGKLGPSPIRKRT